MNDRPNIIESEDRLAAALRAAPEACERPSEALHGRIMSAIGQESGPARSGPSEYLRPMLALAAVLLVAAGVTLVLVGGREDRARAEQARAFVRVTYGLTESARTLERRVLDRAGELLVDPVERQARALRGDAEALLQRVREAIPERSGPEGPGRDG